MEKKVLLKNLVDNGTNLRKQITSKVRVSDNGAYPIGEIWDANTTTGVIVDSAVAAVESTVMQSVREMEARIGDLGTVEQNGVERDVTIKEYVDASRQNAIESFIPANPYPNTWRTNGTMADLIEDINNDPDATTGKTFLNTISVSDLPGDMIQAEVRVDIMSQLGNHKVLLFTTTSSDTAPYHWEYTSAYGREGEWRSWMTNSNNYYTKSEVNQMVSNIDLTDYYTKNQVDSMVSNIASADGYSHVFLTQTEYDNLASKNPNVIYFIIAGGSAFPAEFPITLA